MAGTNVFELSKTLREWRDNQRLAHAYLLTAEKPEALLELAQMATKWLLCEQPLNDGACGQCRSCLQVASGNHPDLEWVQPEGTSLKIQQMREAMRTDMRKTAQGHLQIFVLVDVHKLTTEAASAILKWLEEPYAGRLFLLLTTAPGALLATLRSRVQILRVTESDRTISGKDQHLVLITGEEEAKAEAVRALVREYGEIAYMGRGNGWTFVTEKYSKWSFNPQQALLFTELVIQELRDRAVEAGDAAVIQRFARLALAAFQVRKQLQSHVNAQLAWESFFIQNFRE